MAIRIPYVPREMNEIDNIRDLIEKIKRTARDIVILLQEETEHMTQNETPYPLAVKPMGAHALAMEYNDQVEELAALLMCTDVKKQMEIVVGDVSERCLRILQRDDIRGQIAQKRFNLPYTEDTLYNKHNNHHVLGKNKDTEL